MEAPKSPWRYPHLNFRDDRKKRRNKNNDQATHPRLAFMRRTDSKDSNCSSLSSTTAGGMSQSGSVASGVSEHGGHQTSLQEQVKF